MKQITLLTLATLTALSLSPVTAEAQARSGATYLGLGGGLTIPTGEAADIAKVGWNATAQIGYQKRSGFGLRGEFYYGQHSLDDTFLDTGKFKLVGGLGSVTYTFQSGGKIRPYLVGSVGAMNRKFEGFDGVTKLTYGGGVGFLVRNSGSSSFFAEGRYLSIQTDGNSTNLIPIQVGIRFGI